MATPSRFEAGITVGFIGLGDMGGAIASRIIDAGWSTILWARRPEALGWFGGPNVEAASTPAALAAGADVIGVCVWSDDDVREVVAGDRGLLEGCRPGTIVTIHSTVLPATVRELADLAASAGAIVLDAPVSGGRRVALEGSLTVAVGGDEEALTRCRPVFASFASTIVRLGEVGAAQYAKLINNTLFAANLAMADDAITTGEVFGLDPVALAEFLHEGSGRSYGLDIAMTSRASAATRQAALPALERDVRSLTALAFSDRDALLRDAAAEAVRRLQHPPSTWQ